MANVTSPIVAQSTGYFPCGQNKRDIARHNKELLQKKRIFRNEFIQGQLEDYVHNHESDLFRNVWENNLDKKSLHNQIKWQMDKILKQRQLNLIDRKKRLKELLDSEVKSHEIKERKDAELDHTNRLDNMLKRYKDIMVNKELERLKVADEKINTHFRLNCQDIRKSISERIAKFVFEEGKALAETRSIVDEAKDIEDKMYVEAWIRDKEIKDKKEEEKLNLRKQKNIEYRKDLDDICTYKAESSKIDEDPITEKQLMLEQQRLQEIEKEWEKSQKAINQERTKRDLDKCVKDKLKRRAKEVREDAMLDLYFLEQLIDINKAKKEEKLKQKKVHEDQIKYLKYLSDQIKSHVEYEKHCEEMHNEANIKMWERKEKEWETFAKRRRELNQKAINDCLEQVRNKSERCRLVQETKMQTDEAIKKQFVKDAEDLKKQIQITRQRNTKNQKDILEQISRKQEETRIEKEKQLEEYRNFIKKEKDYDEKIRNIIADPNFDFLNPYRVSKL